MSILSIIFSFGGFVAVVVCEPNNDGLSDCGDGGIIKLLNMGSGGCGGGGGGVMKLLNNGDGGGGGTELLKDGCSGSGGGGVC